MLIVLSCVVRFSIVQRINTTKWNFIEVGHCLSCKVEKCILKLSLAEPFGDIMTQVPRQPLSDFTDIHYTDEIVGSRSHVAMQNDVTFDETENQPQQFSGLPAVYYEHFLVNRYRYFERCKFDNRFVAAVDYIKISFVL